MSFEYFQRSWQIGSSREPPLQPGHTACQGNVVAGIEHAVEVVVGVQAALVQV